MLTTGLQAFGGVLSLSSKKTWRGLGMGSRHYRGTFNGGSAQARTNRTRHYSNVRFRRFRIAIPVAYIALGPPLVDTLFTGDQSVLSFQIGFEYPYIDDTTNLKPRIPVTFNGATSTTYDNSTWNTNYGYILSDIIDLGFTIPPGAFYGLWFTAELPSSHASDALPWTGSASNFIQRNIGSDTNTSSQIATNFALTSTNITPFSTAQTGDATCCMPCAMLIEVPVNTKCIGVIGDSKGDGTGEGGPGSLNYGDVSGSQLSNLGYVERGIYENLGLIGVNVSMDSERLTNLIVPSRWSYRKQFLQLANITHLIQQNIFNDINTTLVASAWASTTAYAFGDIKISGTSYYCCTLAGTSGSTALNSLSTTIGAIITDGSCQWYVLGLTMGSSSLNGVYQIRSNMMQTFAIIRAAFPGIPIIQAKTDINASTTDSFLTIANQTPPAQFTASGQRHYLNIALDGPDPLLGTYKTYDPANGIEYNYGTETGKWIVDGIHTQYLVADTGHQNSRGCAITALTITNSLFN